MNVASDREHGRFPHPRLTPGLFSYSNKTETKTRTVSLKLGTNPRDRDYKLDFLRTLKYNRFRTSIHNLF